MGIGKGELALRKIKAVKPNNADMFGKFATRTEKHLYRFGRR